MAPAEPHGRCRTHRIWIVALALLSLALLIALIVREVQRGKHASADLGARSPAGPACPDGWIGFRGKCYYFSESEKDWASSQNNCTALGASLAKIDTRQEKDFMVRYKDTYDHWIGLWRDPGQPWKWVDGTELNKWFQVAGGEGDCVSLNNQGGVSSFRCTNERYWICSKPDVFTAGKETAVTGGSEH